MGKHVFGACGPGSKLTLTSLTRPVLVLSGLYFHHSWKNGDGALNCLEHRAEQKTPMYVSGPHYIS